MRYTLQLNVKLIEIPEIQDNPRSGEDSMQDMARVITGVIAPGGMMPIPRQPSGMEYNKSVAVNASNFSNLSKIVSEFDKLTEQLQLESV